MSLNIESMVRLVELAKAKARTRRFRQSYELIVHFTDDFDVKKPENRFNIIIPLPHALPKPPRVCVMATGSVMLAARDAKADLVLGREDVEKLSGNKKEVRKLAQYCDFFVATPDLMVLIGRGMGQILGPRGKMPEVIQPNADVKAIVERLRRSVRVRVKDQPQVMCRVGTEDMEPRKVAENAMAVLEEITKKVKPEQIRNIGVKLTMGPIVTLKDIA